MKEVLYQEYSLIILVLYNYTTSKFAIKQYVTGDEEGQSLLITKQ